MKTSRWMRGIGHLAAAWAILLTVGHGADEVSPVTEVPASALPLISIRAFLDGAPVWGEKRTVRVRGTVTHVISDKTFFIQDGDAATYVFHKPPVPHRVGELVEVVGLPSLGGFSPTLHYCDTRVIGEGKALRRAFITPAEAMTGAYNMRLVSLRGYLSADRLGGGQMLVLTPENGGDGFTADLEAEPRLGQYDSLKAGSLLEISGVCSVKRSVDGSAGSFKLFVHSPQDIQVIKPPPWLTLKRTVTGLGILAMGLVVTLVWIRTLRREVRQQTASVRLLNEQLERRVRERTSELEAANREMEAFNYSVSHDLRTPLRYISGFIELAREEQDVSLNPEVQRYLQKISDAAEQMGKLIDALLLFSKMSRQPIQRQPVEMTVLVSDVVKALDPDVAGRDIEWKVGTLPEVNADPEMLRLVWMNLIANAVKYTRTRKKAVIEIEAHCSDEVWTFLIRDNGVGFDSKSARRLFEVFQRFHRDDEFEGTGVGLANVRRIIERHGGRIWAESTIGHGATFFFTLPMSGPAGSSESDGNL